MEALTNEQNAAESAYPQPCSVLPNGEVIYGVPGLTKRELFTAMCMQGLCANPAVFAANPQSGWSLVNCDETTLANYAKLLADAALTALEQKHG